MLRLKKAPGADSIALTYATKAPLFTPEFSIALGSAIGLHLLGLLLFTVHTTFYAGSNQILSPVLVLTEPLEFEKDSLIIADPFLDPIHKKSVPEPPSQNFSRPSKTEEIFISKEEGKISGSRLPDWPVSHTSYPAYSMTATGSLAGKRLLVEPKLPKTKTIGDFTVIHQVRLDERSGKVFWYKLQKSSGKTSIDQIAEKMLKATVFAPKGTDEISSGAIEWKFHIEDSND